MKKKTIKIDIDDELKKSYLDYAMSVIIGRALPDVRDGLKPVHRRILFAMYKLKNFWNRSFLKSARVVGNVIGKYHPHGDNAVYDTIVRMAQKFSMRYLLIDGQGNFGSIDGDSAAAMRYTEIRMNYITNELLFDIDKETVDWVNNYDNSEIIPKIFPTRIPNILINGSSGIAVGMATNIPPHNLCEVINACLALIDDSTLSINSLIKNYIFGPDFPTAGIIFGKAGIIEAYKTGKGCIYIRAKYIINFNKNTCRDIIIITELPYQVNKFKLIEKIVSLIKEKRIEGIYEVRDDSDKNGVRIIIEIKKGKSGKVIINNLFYLTQLETLFYINMIALDEVGKPKKFNLKEVLKYFIDHRKEIIIRRSIYELNESEIHAHILEGLIVAIYNLDEIIKLIKLASSIKEAKLKLINRKWNLSKEIIELFIEKRENYIYCLTEKQALAILDLRLHSLTSIEIKKLLYEYDVLLNLIKKLKLILSSNKILMEVIKKELNFIKKEYGDSRRTEIKNNRVNFTPQDLIYDEYMVFTIYSSCYAKTQPISILKNKKIGLKINLLKNKNEDLIQHVLIASKHETIFFFSNKGKLYCLKIYEIPEASKISRGSPIINLLSIKKNEQITAIFSIKKYKKESNILLATSLGKVKRINIDKFSHTKSSGLIAIKLDKGDSLISAAITSGNNNVILITSYGNLIRFDEKSVLLMERYTYGMIGISLNKNDRVISLIIPNNKTCYILFAYENGFCKFKKLSNFYIKNIGGQGSSYMQISKRNGLLVSAIQVYKTDKIILITNKGNIIILKLNESQINSKGFILISMINQEKLVTIVRLDENILKL